MTLFLEYIIEREKWSLLDYQTCLDVALYIVTGCQAARWAGCWLGFDFPLTFRSTTCTGLWKVQSERRRRLFFCTVVRRGYAIVCFGRVYLKHETRITSSMALVVGQRATPLDLRASVRSRVTILVCYQAAALERGFG